MVKKTEMAKPGATRAVVLIAGALFLFSCSNPFGSSSGGGSSGGSEGSSEPDTGAGHIEVELDLQEDLALFDGEPENEVKLGESFAVSSVGFGETVAYRWRLNGDPADSVPGVAIELLESEDENRSELTIDTEEASFSVGTSVLIVLEVTIDGDLYSGSHSLTVTQP